MRQIPVDSRPWARAIVALLCFVPLVCWAATTDEIAPPGSQALLSPRIYPDYVGVTVPPNIAPLNFQIQEPGKRFRVELRSRHGKSVVTETFDGIVRIPAAAWRSLLKGNTGELLYCDIAVGAVGSSWKAFATITNQIAAEEIDGFLAYRLLKPLFNSYVHLGIYQRDLTSYEQSPILENNRFGNGCLNCHTPLNGRPDTFAFQTRGAPKEQPMILVISNQVSRVDKTMGYLAWHPSGRALAFSANRLSLFYHTTGETRDVYDERSDLGLYRVDSNRVVFPRSIASPKRNETWPAWSPDGRYLYFSSAPPLAWDKFRRIRYDLVRISYQIETDEWGEPELIVSAQETGLSACQPKISPDGRWLLYTACKYGNFPVYQPDSDLYVIDLATRQSRRLSINSEQADSWHSWSRNSRWVVFSSKRLDGLFARPHFSYVDAHGEFHKPFLLPQADPLFYDSCVQTFNVPEFMDGPVQIPASVLAKAVRRPDRVLLPDGPPQLGGKDLPTAGSVHSGDGDPAMMHE